MATLIALTPMVAGMETSARAQTQEVLYGFTAFPHDLTAQATEQVHQRIKPISTLYAQHMDQCVPWHQVLAKTPFPQWLERDLEEIRQRKGPTQTLYVAVTPTKNDRRTLAAACGDEEGKERWMPWSLRNAKFDSPAVRFAYTTYVQRIVDALNPRYLNIGIEMSELALKHPAEWPAFDRLFRHTVDALRKSHPDVKVGLELVLQSIMKPSVSALVKPTAEYGDYVGISFYPYGSEFGEKFGAPALPPPPEQWRGPLRYLRNWTTKPVAIAETGYTTANIRLESAGVDFRGDVKLQEAFLRDLMDEAIRDRYLFVVWFVPIDYTRLMDKFRSLGRHDEWMNIWVNAGLYDAQLQPKPALAAWQLWRRQAELKAAPPRFR